MKKKFSFKGDRTYLHSTTLMDYIVRNIISSDDELKDIDFSMSRFTDKICEIVPDDQMQDDDSRVVGLFRYGGQKLLVLETTEKITRRVEYDEDKILNNCEVVEDNKIIVAEDTYQFSFMEKTISAYKALLQQIFGASYHSYFFIRITLDTIPEGQIEITYNRIISKKYFQATITQHGSRIGVLYFGARQ